MEKQPESFFVRNRKWHPPAYYPPYKSSVARAPELPLIAIPQTLSELTGPKFSTSMLGKLDNDLLYNYGNTDIAAIGEQIVVHGKVLDEGCKPVEGVMVEVWQANAGGRYRHLNEKYDAPLDDNFGGMGRCITDAEGRYFFRTVKPGPYPWPNGMNDWRPAHIHFSLIGRGFADRLITQMYFEGDPLIPHCPIVSSIPCRDAIDQLIARLDLANTEPMRSLAYRFDIVLRGRRQTFFESHDH